MDLKYSNARPNWGSCFSLCKTSDSAKMGWVGSVWGLGFKLGTRFGFELSTKGLVGLWIFSSKEHPSFRYITAI